MHADEGKKLHFVSPARRKSVLAPIINKIKNGTDAGSNGSGGGGGGGGSGASSVSGSGTGGGGSGGTGSDTEKKSNATDSSAGHISVQIEPAKRVKVNKFQITTYILCKHTPVAAAAQYILTICI